MRRRDSRRGLSQHCRAQTCSPLQRVVEIAQHPLDVGKLVSFSAPSDQTFVAGVADPGLTSTPFHRYDRWQGHRSIAAEMLRPAAYLAARHSAIHRRLCSRRLTESVTRMLSNSGEVAHALFGSHHQFGRVHCGCRIGQTRSSAARRAPRRARSTTSAMSRPEIHWSVGR